MRKRENLRVLSRLMSVLLVFSLLSGLCVQAAAQSPEEDGAGSRSVSLLQAPEAKAGAQADKNILAYALREAKKVVDSGQLDRLASNAPAGLKERFEAAVAAADTVYQNDDATNEEIQTAYKELQDVMWQLSYVMADKTALQDAVDHAKAIDLSGYTAESVSAFQEALAAAEALLEGDLSIGQQPQIDAAIKALETAESQLATHPPVTPSTPSGSGSSGSKPSKPEPPEEPGEDDGKEPNPPVKYEDVSSDAWYAEGVEYVSSLGIMNGTGSEQFSPSATTSRAMIWTMLYRLAGEPEQDGDSSVWYGKAMSWSQENGISDGSNPGSAITREQLAVTLYRYAGAEKTDIDLSAYSDSAEISAWAQDGMMWAVKTGLINGKGNGILDPKGTATRAEAATIFMRFMQNLQDSKEAIG
ncbi:MAG: hypothetical protein HDT14_05495 [Oscillibacter sp.]|nr:hypothetical protein [Oscillibacter sp.]